MLDLNGWLAYYKSRAELVDNKCHTLSRLNCDDISLDKWEQISQGMHSLSTRHLFYESVSCARRVFGQEEEIEYTELKQGVNQFSRQSNDFQYFILHTESSSMYVIDVQFEIKKNVLAYDYFNCLGRKDYTNRPDDKVNCKVLEDLPTFHGMVCEPGSHIYISIKYQGTVKFNITTDNSIEVTGKAGSIKSNIARGDHYYSYKAPTPGYIFVETSVISKDHNLSLYYDTPGCTGKVDTHFPRSTWHCLKKTNKNNVQLFVPNQDNDRIHYFSLLPDNINNVQFTYVLFGITEIGEGRTQFKFDNAFAMPFKYSAKKGAHHIIVTVSNELVNKCDIYLDYAGCTTKSTVLPNSHNNCLLTTNKTEDSCSLKFVLDEDVDVYFGVETIISERMTVEIITNDKLVFLE
jgi:hypothetical protein